MNADLSRRTFLLAGAGLLVAAACARDDDSDIDVADGGTGEDALSLVVATYVHTVGPDQRVTFGILRGESPLRPEGDVLVAFTGPDGSESDPLPAEVHADGIELPYLLVRHEFRTAGVHEAHLRYQGQSLKAALQVADPSGVKVPLVGRPLVRVPTPTTADARGVDPVCTRKPACPLHEVSLDAALDRRQPIALLFSTPALCQSQLCGPVLDNLLATRDEFGDRVQYLHVEIYTDLGGKTLTEPVKAFNLENEPFLFLAGADGVVRARLDNAFDRREVREALSALVA